MYKERERDARAKLLFCQSKPISFLPFSLPSPSSFLKLPYVDNDDNIANRSLGALCFLAKVLKRASLKVACVASVSSRSSSSKLGQEQKKNG